MQDEIMISKELAFVYIVKGKRFLCKKKAKRYRDRITHKQEERRKNNDL